MATYYFRNTGDVNWGTATNWSLTDGGGATGAVPTATDDAYFTSNSSNCTVNASARVCKTLVFSGVGAGNYANTITMTNGITVSGNVTLSAGMTIAGTGSLTISATSTYTSNGITWPNTLSLTRVGVDFTVTLGDNVTVNVFQTTTGLPGTLTLNSNNLYVTGNFTINCGLIGSTNINLTTTTTQTWSGSSVLGNNLNLNSTGTIIISGTVLYSNGNLKYTAGTLTTTGSTIRMNNNNCNITSNGITWGSFLLNGIITLTLNDNCTINDLTISTGANIINGNNLYIQGNLSHVSACSGTTTININGTGAQTWSGAGTLSNNFVINKSSGTLTLSGNISYGGASSTLTYTAGSITPGTITFTTVAGTTYSISSSGFTLYNFSPLTGTHTINTGTITVNNNLTFNGNTTFAGTGGWTAAILTDSTAGRTLTLKDGINYTITSALSLTGTNASPFVITSSSATLRANFILNQGASQTIQFVKATRIDSSGGQTIWDTVGTIVSPLTDTINWNSGAKPAPMNVISMG